MRSLLFAALFLVSTTLCFAQTPAANGAFGEIKSRPKLPVELVTVGNPGNLGELSGAGAGGAGPDGTCSAVGYVYQICKYEVSAGEYTVFMIIL